MSIKRQVTITCDGPCGTVVNAGVIPDDWVYLRLHGPHLQVKGALNDLAHLCPKCSKRVNYELQALNIALQPSKKEHETT